MGVTSRSAARADPGSHEQASLRRAVLALGLPGSGLVLVVAALILLGDGPSTTTVVLAVAASVFLLAAAAWCDVLARRLTAVGGAPAASGAPMLRWVSLGQAAVAVLIGLGGGLSVAIPLTVVILAAAIGTVRELMRIPR